MAVGPSVLLLSPAICIRRRLAGNGRNAVRQPQQHSVYSDPFHRQVLGRPHSAVSQEVAATSSAETWDVTRIKPLYEQMLAQFHAADLDGSVSLTGVFLKGRNACKELLANLACSAGMESLIVMSCERYSRLLRVATMAAIHIG